MIYFVSHAEKELSTLVVRREKRLFDSFSVPKYCVRKELFSRRKMNLQGSKIRRKKELKVRNVALFPKENATYDMKVSSSLLWCT